jgi:hypothetical protein
MWVMVLIPVNTLYPRSLLKAKDKESKTFTLALYSAINMGKRQGQSALSILYVGA